MNGDNGSPPSADFIVHSLLDDLPLSPVEFRFYAHAVRRAGLGGKYYESVPNAAKYCRVKENTLRAARERCTSLGLLKLTDSPPGRTWTYKVCAVKDWKLPTPAKEDPGPTLRGSNEAPGPPQTRHRDPLKRGTGTPSNEAPQRSSLKVSPEDDPRRRSGQQIVLKVESKRPEAEQEPDWHGLTPNQKLLKVLGNDVMAREGDLWIKRLQRNPKVIAEVVDTMWANIKEGAIIKDRARYASALWIKAK